MIALAAVSTASKYNADEGIIMKLVMVRVVWLQHLDLLLPRYLFTLLLFSPLEFGEFMELYELRIDPFHKQPM